MKTIATQCTCDLRPKGQAARTGGVVRLELTLVKCSLCEAAPDLLQACSQFLYLIRMGFLVLDTSQDPDPDPLVRRAPLEAAIEQAHKGILKAAERL